MIWPFNVLKRRRDQKILMRADGLVTQWLNEAKINLKKNPNNDPHTVDMLFFELFPNQFRAPDPDPLDFNELKEEEDIRP